MSAPERLRAAGTALIHRAGDGPELPVVLLHGIGSNAESWSAVLSALSHRVSAFAWDAPGYGDSEPLADPSPRPADYADRLRFILDELGLGQVVLAGHSLGCLFAGAFAARYPDRVRVLALLSPALGYGIGPGEPLPKGVQLRLDDLAALGPAGMAEKRAARLVHDAERKPEALAAVRRAMAAIRPEGYAQAVRALAAGDLLADARALEIPVSVTIGLEDVVTPPSNAQAVRAVLRHPLKARDLIGVGHAVPQEEPATVAKVLRGLATRALE
ncbi:alpha/beta fold hydrolase [Roseomonas sp. CCTCC AB2023176]|uniref:alpha/beta fold hydrolase n=1 Tax=Roseomonas sp. CCTCC AB2023176 TaxID=3342640 RepID=UPI0035E2C9CD